MTLEFSAGSVFPSRLECQVMPTGMVSLLGLSATRKHTDGFLVRCVEQVFSCWQVCSAVFGLSIFSGLLIRSPSVPFYFCFLILLFFRGGFPY